MRYYPAGHQGISLFCPRKPVCDRDSWRLPRFPETVRQHQAGQIGPLANLASPAGCAIRLLTDAKHCEIRLTDLRHHQSYPVALDVETVSPDGRRILHGSELRWRRGEVVDRFTMTVPGEPARMREVWIWLPPISTCACASIGLPDDAQLEPPSPVTVSWLAIGDSLTQGFAARSYTETWVHRCMRRWDRLAWNLGLAGVGIDPELFGSVVGEDHYEVVTVGLGANHAWRVSGADGLEGRIDGLLDHLRPIADRCLWLLPPWKPCEAGLGPTAYAGVALDAAAGVRMGLIRDRIARRLEEHRDFVRVLTDLLPHQVDLQPDGVHPQAAGFAVMAERLAAALGPAETDPVMNRPQDRRS